MLEQPYYTAYGKTREILKTLSTADLRTLGEKLGLHSDIIDEPTLVIDIGAELITDSPELGKLIPAK